MNNNNFIVSPHSKDIFNGLTEEEVKNKSLPDHLKDGLDIVIVSIYFFL